MSGQADASLQGHVHAQSEGQVYLWLYAGVCHRVGGGEYKLGPPAVK